MKVWIRVLLGRPWLVIIAGLALTAVAAGYGLSVFSRLSNSGYGDPRAASQQAANILSDTFTDQRADVIILFSAHEPIVANPALAAAVQHDLATVSASAGVGRVSSYFSTGLNDFLSVNGHQTFATVGLNGSYQHRIDSFHTLRATLHDHAGLSIAFGGNTVINDQISGQISDDLSKAELLSFPILAVLLLIVFRSVVAALVPLGLGALSILVAFLLVRLITNVTDVSVYAINIITLMGLGLAIDYSLFIVSRFREELAGGATVNAALQRTLQTAGRTVGFSALTVILSLLGLLVFPQGFLRSMGFGGAAAVGATAILALTVLPAALKLLGRRINALALPGLRHSLNRPAGHGFWYRYSHVMMRRPLVTLAVALELLIILGLPFMTARFSTPDAKTVPANLSGRQVNDQLERNFAGAGESQITVVARADGAASLPANQQKLRDYLDRLGAVSGVSQARVNGLHGNYYSAQLTELYDSQTRSARQTVQDVRAVAAPAGWTVYTGGATAELVDLLDGLAAKLPLAGAIIVLTTSVLLFMMLGSIVIPVKAVILNILSLSAAFGVLVWIFQDGHLAQPLGLIANGTIDATQPVLIFAIAFGLAMDYELFLLSRIKEEFDRTHDNTHSVAVGVERTAGIITSAALMLVVVIGLFATGKIGIIQQVGVGLGAAVAIDATVVRMVLVPSAMRLLGDLNWWAPGPLARLSARLNIRESSS